MVNYQTIDRCIYLSIHLSIYLFITIYQSILVSSLSHLSIYYPFIHLFILYIICPFSPSIHLSIFLSHVRRNKYLIAPARSSTGYGIAHNSRVKTTCRSRLMDFYFFIGLRSVFGFYCINRFNRLIPKTTLLKLHYFLCITVFQMTLLIIPFYFIAFLLGLAYLCHHCILIIWHICRH